MRAARDMVFAIVRLSAFARYYSLPDPDNLHFPLVGNVVSLISVAGRRLDAHRVLENAEINILSPYDSEGRARDWTVKYAAEIAIWNQALEEISNYSQMPVNPPHFSPPPVPAKKGQDLKQNGL
ncbi:hypothetical protein CASFOL_003847 [Castilleja foliolosa]|uniref:Uncharacterized protein n=1 Tax=Castilleja foliolosa TaxID=1961234 RepID=A0ABD3EIY2_9LAMI